MIGVLTLSMLGDIFWRRSPEISFEKVKENFRYLLHYVTYADISSERVKYGSFEPWILVDHLVKPFRTIEHL